ncbi:hypothetical protein A2634_05415 [Candidatus Amesbacteria bacterium RIFCSPHIGHO2_01_FULL_48_32]|uniref:AAA+ ATPase domain-containing protein n=1 Tax=Candidatus Amesbacteria bacterium RIFCSPLOWO2_01_FULL_48_25 TaxID=1797259 RepID=A0A1F4ZD62_9BACT|nr:MAG: hypothetical protein A2634_05415 [Candidatus Amesbacteria bacterium RIFCSPHIGHO2_01_FULL_48_32]OGD04105.1 MAG: hypothetical protein A2989_01765 [Candidatus Amesbacteria bacterium RIFCSPLOWO2_01_FULL_48_25]HJZ05628.1 GspE/PulE family protein [Patescibacteria group bacterium]
MFLPLPPEQFKAMLLKSGLVDPKVIPEAEQFAINSGLNLYEALLEKGLATDDKLGALVSGALKVPMVDLGKTVIPESVSGLIPERVARKHKVVAFAREKDTLKVATSDPTQPEIFDILRKKTGLPKIAIYYATDADITHLLRSFKKDLQKLVDDLLKADVWGTTTTLEDPPVAKIVDALIDTAYQQRASDIHIEPQENRSLVRLRIDGILTDVLSIPKYLHDRITTRIKVLSSLRTDEHLSAQDGKMRAKLEEENLDIRVSIVPVVDGEKAVLRLLSSRSREYTFASLGMNEADLKKVSNAYTKSYGMVLSTGPTGSGKTTSIYSILKILNTREKNITTVEDPVEYRIAGANQIQVNVKTNLTFANGLRSILRQDPNIIFVGEIRDSETAAIAVNAALTGHLVLSTLHTNDAATAIPRLSDMKVEPYLVASTVSVIVAQRLVRQVCQQCKIPVEVSYAEMTKNFPADVVKKSFGTNAKTTIYQGQGCKLCHQSGYSGRIGVFEVLEVNKNIRKLIIQKSDSDVILKAAVAEGMKTMLEDGLEKVARGETTIEEILRVTKSEFLS